MEREGFYQLLKSLPRGETEAIEQEFTSALSNVDVPVPDFPEVEGERLRRYEDLYGYRAAFFILLAFVVVWGIVLMLNRTPPLHLNSCEALKYYLGALDEASRSLPAGTREFLDKQAALCPDDDLGGFDDGNPHQ